MNMKKLAAAGLLATGVAVVLIAGSRTRDYGAQNIPVPSDPASTAPATATTAAATPATAATPASTAGATPTPATAATPTVHVYKTATCGCCAKWVEHLRAAGFAVTVEDTRDLMAIKRREGVPGNLNSCHTALVNGYVVEGHVPASVVQAFLDEAPDARGLAVPGMPMGSPGMEGRYSEAYDVFAFDAEGGRTVYRHIEPQP